MRELNRNLVFCEKLVFDGAWCPLSIYNSINVFIILGPCQEENFWYCAGAVVRCGKDVAEVWEKCEKSVRGAV